MNRDSEAPPGPLALLFSGGASLGAVHVGQLRAVAEAELPDDLVVDTSVGASETMARHSHRSMHV